MKQHRPYFWLLIVIIIIAAGLSIVAARQQNNFNDHEQIDQHVCALSVETRTLISDGFHTIGNNAQIDPETAAELHQLGDRAERLVTQTKAACKAD